MIDDKPKFEAFQKENGETYLEEFLDSLSLKDRRKLLATIKQIQEVGMLNAIRMQWVKRLDSEIFEIRSKQGSDIQRVLYFHKVQNKYIITHGFTKKTQKTPIKELEKAHRIRDEFLRIQRND